MKEDLLKYMSKRSAKQATEMKTGGPVITISREKGCPANNIANELAKQLSKEKKEANWRWINKDILEQSAKELHLNPSKINHVLYSEDKGFFRDLMLSFGEKYYESDVHIKRTLSDIILNSAIGGHVIIVGLGGVAITKNIPKSLHIKLFAPYKHRLKMVMEKENMNSEKAMEYMEETDVNRKMIIDYYNGIKAHEDLFHAEFNTSLLTESEIVQAIVQLLKSKNLID